MCYWFHNYIHYCVFTIAEKISNIGQVQSYCKNYKLFKFFPFINTAVQHMSVQYMYVNPFENFFFQIPIDKPIVASTNNKIQNKDMPIPISNQNKDKTNIKIGSINICGGLEKKVPYINAMLKKKKYDILALVESHTYKSDKSWLDTSFDGYQVFCEGDNQTTVFRNYRAAREKQILDMKLSEKETEIELSKISEYNALNYNRVVVLVNREISHAFAEKCNIVPDHRGVSLAFKTKYNKITFFHFVYAPTEYNAKKEFWQKFSDNFKSKHEHLIIGDLFYSIAIIIHATPVYLQISSIHQ